MPFIARNFAPAGANSSRGNAPGLYTYSTLDATAVVDTTGYFNEVSSMLSVGDVIKRVSWTTAIGAGGTVASYGEHIVLSNAAGVVDTSDTTVGVVTDTD